MTEPANPADPKALGREWLERIRTSEKGDTAEWFKQAEDAEAIYAQSAQSGTSLYDFNILHSNVETILPSLYNSTAIPDVRERFRTGPASPEASAARQVAKLIERAIVVQTDDGKLDTEAMGLLDLVHPRKARGGSIQLD